MIIKKNVCVSKIHRFLGYFFFKQQTYKKMRYREDIVGTKYHYVCVEYGYEI